jgi:2-haloacid dehalogenase
MLNFDQFKILTFDCYGTLIDWETGILSVLRPLLIEHDLAVGDDQILETYSELESAIEAGPYKPYRAVLSEITASLGQQFEFLPQPHEFTALAESLPDWPPFEDTVEALKRLKSKFQLGIISNIDDDLFAASNKQLQVEFDYIITAGQVGAYKPSLKMFEAAIERIGLKKKNILHVAQSLFHDHIPAQEFELTTVWINRRHDRPGSGATPRAEVIPDAEFHDLASLAGAIGL